MELRKEISTLLGVRIPENKWQETFDSLLPRGFIGPKQQIQMLVILLQHVEALENGSNPKK